MQFLNSENYVHLDNNNSTNQKNFMENLSEINKTSNLCYDKICPSVNNPNEVYSYSNQNKIFWDVLENQINKNENNKQISEDSYFNNGPKPILTMNSNEKIFRNIFEDLIKKNEINIKNEDLSKDGNSQEGFIQNLIDKSIKSLSNSNFLNMIKRTQIFKDPSTFNKYSHLKTLIYRKINDILSNNGDNDQKYILYNLISNASKSQSNDIKPNIDYNNGNSFQQNEENVSSLIDKCSQNYLVKNIIDKFCSYLNNNGFSIVSKQNLNLNQNNNKNLNEEINSNNNFSCGSKDSIKRKKEVILCHHKDRKHYARNMCSNCYHKQGRIKKAWLCIHKNKPHYAKGKCHICYLNCYNQVNKKLLFSKKKSLILINSFLINSTINLTNLFYYLLFYIKIE